MRQEAERLLLPARRDLDNARKNVVLCHTPKELAGKRAELGIVSQAVEDGIPL